ncbi:hypothetical protein ACN08X_04390, partial [Rothia sp. P6271]|uniref:hypothetical protein n=1 Tax=Rothia sp. P6271 TaxID=3402659 RepID=UPI003AC3040B
TQKFDFNLTNLFPLDAVSGTFTIYLPAFKTTTFFAVQRHNPLHPLKNAQVLPLPPQRKPRPLKSVQQDHKLVHEQAPS